MVIIVWGKIHNVTFPPFPIKKKCSYRINVKDKVHECPMNISGKT